MRRLMLLRHAKSDWSHVGQRDHDRDLNERGRSAAPKIGAYLARQALLPNCVRVSTARRTRETWKRVAAAFPSPPKAVFDDRIYEAEPDTLRDVIQDAPASCHTLLLIGHNPGLQDLALSLVKDGNAEALNRLAAKFPTAGLAVIDLPIDDWAMLQPRTGRLSLFVTPRSVEEST